MSRKSSRVANREKEEKKKSSNNEKGTEKKKSSNSSEKGEFGLKWIFNEDDFFYICDSSDLKGSKKIAAFDLDGTLIEPKSGRAFPTGREDWKWWNDGVPSKLKELHKSGYKIIIFTNQGGIEKNKQDRSDITGKILDIVSELGFPVQAFVAGAENAYRKPFTSMWEVMVKKYNSDVEVDLSKSYYIGDAAGREKGWKTRAKKDFSCGDRKFAANIGIEFHTPDEFFLEENEAEFKWGTINPTEVINMAKKQKLKREKKYHSNKQEMVIVVGWPASGKSTFTKKYFEPHNYVRVNRDTLKTQAKCQKAVKEALTEGKSVIVDNTNPSSTARAEFITIAQNNDIPVRCFYFTTPRELAAHLNYVRVKESNGEIRRIPDVAYNIYNKHFEEPTKDEGYDEIVKIDFVPDFEDNPELEKIFKCWT